MYTQMDKHRYPDGSRYVVPQHASCTSRLVEGEWWTCIAANTEFEFYIGYLSTSLGGSNTPELNRAMDFKGPTIHSKLRSMEYFVCSPLASITAAIRWGILYLLTEIPDADFLESGEAHLSWSISWWSLILRACQCEPLEIHIAWLQFRPDVPLARMHRVRIHCGMRSLGYGVHETLQVGM